MGVLLKINNLLEDIINRLKISLKEDTNGIIIGEFNDVIASIKFNSLHLTPYKSFLKKQMVHSVGRLIFGPMRNYLIINLG